MAKRHGVSQSSEDLQARFGRMIRLYRLRLGITQEELAWRADMHRTYIADIERGGRNITLQSIGKIAEALKVPVKSLLPDTVPETADAARSAEEILVVERDAAQAAAIVRMLLRAKIDARIHVVENVEAATRHLFDGRRNRLLPRVVMIDAGVTGAAGLVRRLRVVATKRPITIAAVASARWSPAEAECRRAGADLCWRKPLKVGPVTKLAVKLDLASGRIAR